MQAPGKSLLTASRTSSMCSRLAFFVLNLSYRLQSPLSILFIAIEYISEKLLGGFRKRHMLSGHASRTTLSYLARTAGGVFNYPLDYRFLIVLLLKQSREGRVLHASGAPELYFFPT